jgi:hypothetical protein
MTLQEDENSRRRCAPPMNREVVRPHEHHER